MDRGVEEGEKKNKKLEKIVDKTNAGGLYSSCQRGKPDRPGAHRNWRTP